MRARGGGVEEGATGGGRSGKADGGGGGMFYHGDADGGTAAVDEGERGGWETAGDDGAVDGGGDEFGCARVGAVGLDDDRAACGECRGGVAAGDGEREGEVGGAEDDDGAEGDEHAAEIGAREWLAVGERGIDPRVDPGPLTNDRGEEAELAARAAAFADQACLGQSGLGVGALNKWLTQGFDFKGDGFEELRALRAGALPVGGKGHGGRREGGGDFGGGRLVKRGLHLGIRRRIGGVKCLAAGLTGSAGEEAEAVEEHGGK